MRIEPPDLILMLVTVSIEILYRYGFEEMTNEHDLTDIPISQAIVEKMID